MQKIFTLIIFILTGVVAFGQSENINGIWLTEDKSAQVKIYNSNNQFFGKIIWLKDPVNPKTGKSWLDEQNENALKRVQPLIGSLILWNFKYNDEEYTGGKVYDSRNGKTYSGKLWLAGNKLLKVRGYLGFVYSTETWTRIDK